MEYVCFVVIRFDHNWERTPKQKHIGKGLMIYKASLVSR